MVTDKQMNAWFQKLYDKSVDTAESLVDTLTIFATDMIIPRKIKTKSISIV